jgi:predicted AlkP superfamily pyrophosphatase or phosphodiesterase
MTRRAALLLLVLVSLVGGAALALRALTQQPDPVPQPEPQPKPEQPATPDAPPKLVVLVVFDQMRGEYPARWAAHYGPGGFERFKRDGAWFSQCFIPYACTSTGPGHASLATGAPPSVTGIIENEWYDRATAARMYCCQPKRPYDLVPPVPPELGKPGRGAATGYSPERLLAETVGDALRAAHPASRVFSLSIKDRTAVLMGGQKASGAYCFDTRDGKFHTGAFYRPDGAHAWVTEFNTAKLADKWFDATWDRFKPELDYAKFSGPDDAPGEAIGFNGQGGAFPHPLKGKLTAPAKPYYDALECSPFGNELLLALVQKCVTAEKLGRGETPDLLLVSFSSTDLAGHQWGPDSQEMFDIMLRADKVTADLLAFLDAEVGKGKWTVALTADHGVCPLPELASSKGKYTAAARHPVADLVQKLNLALQGVYGGADAQWLEAFDDGTWPWVYLNHKTIEARKLKVDDVATVARDWLANNQPYIETALTRADIAAAESPRANPFAAQVALAFHPDRCGDVIVIPKPGVLVTPYKGGTSHGSPHAYDAHIPFMLVGAGVPALGERKEKVSSLAVAPALARALGIAPPKHATTPAPALAK